MPYIDKRRRVEVETDGPNTAGELCYLLSKVVADYIEAHGHRFQTMSDAVGALEVAKLETYRRVVAKHEDSKLIQNGDVFPRRD